MSEVFGVLGLPFDGTLQDAVDQTQKSLLRPVGKERWEVEDRFQEYSVELIPLLEKLGLVNELKPQKRYYDYAVILGSRFSSMRNRLTFLVDEYMQGVRFGQLVFLVGTRQVTDFEKEELRSFLPKGHSVPDDETVLARDVYTYTSMPQSLRTIPVTFIDAKPSKGNSRATTDDTIEAWIATNPKPGTVLAVSSQPYVGYQEAVMARLLSTFEVEGVGSRSKETNMSVLLDNFARWLYSLNQLPKPIHQFVVCTAVA